MSILPEQKVKSTQGHSLQNQMFQSNSKLLKLAPLKGSVQRHKVSICDNNLLIQDLNELHGSKKSQSINQLMVPSNRSQVLQNLVTESRYQNKSSLANSNKQASNYLGSNNSQLHLRSYKENANNESMISNNSSKISHQNTNTGLIIEKTPFESQILKQTSENKETILTPTVDEQKLLTLGEYYMLFKTKIQQLLESIPFQVFITLLTICSLFMEDFRTIFIDRDDDHVIDYANLFFLSVFFLQILMSLSIENYPFSFFFYLDLISTFSICMDVTIFTDVIYNSGGNSQQINILITQSKASRAAARAVRIMKIFRLARVVKLYKSAVKTRQLNEQKQQQRLKERLKLKKNYNKNNSGFMNENFEGQTSQYKLSFANSLSIRDKEFGMSDKSENGGSNSLKQSLNHKRQKTITKRQGVEMIDKIHEEPQDQETSQNPSRLNQNHSEIQEDNAESNIMNSLQLSSQQSKISKILSDSTIKKIIIVILIIMFSMTALDINNYYPQNTSWDFLTKYVAKLLLQPNVPIEHINSIIKKNIDYFQGLDINSEVIAFETPFKELYGLQTVDYSLLRITEIGLSEASFDVAEVLKVRPYLTFDQDFILSENSTALFDSITVVLSYKKFNEIDSWFSIGKIVFICLTIIYLLQSFNTNISELIVSPIEKMLQIIINPEKTLQKEQEDNHDFKEARYETRIVQKAIVKIRGLMSTIFGKIGMDLIYNQLFKTQNINANNYLQVKKKTFSIYAFCKIQNFVEISQTLQADTFTFVNQIAHIVHSAAYRYGGYGVKNLTDGFLIVFKLPEGKQQEIIDEATKSKYSKQKKNTYLSILCDFSIYSLVKIIVRLHKEPKLLHYKKDQRILQKFGNNFRIDMSFSIGIGQSIEGMIGSEFKIDPVYLGGKLDQIWKISRVSQKYSNLIIMEKQLFQNLTVGLKNHCRVMDYTKLSQYDDGETELYTVDLDLQYISPSRSKAEKYKKKQDQPDIHLKKQLNMQNLKNSTQISNYYAEAFINSKKQLREVMKKKISDDMRKKYQIAFQAYISGDWIEAKQSFQEIMRVIKEDVLSKRIYNFMLSRNFKFADSIPQYKSVKDL